MRFFIGVKMEQINLEMVRGDDDGFVFEVVEDTEQQSAVDFAGCRLDLHIKPKRGEAIKLSSTTGEIVVENNLIIVNVPHGKTESVKWESAPYDLQCIDKNGKVRTLVGGEFVLILDVTVVENE